MSRLAKENHYDDRGKKQPEWNPNGTAFRNKDHAMGTANFLQIPIHAA